MTKSAKRIKDFCIYVTDFALCYLKQIEVLKDIQGILRYYIGTVALNSLP